MIKRILRIAGQYDWLMFTSALVLFLIGLAAIYSVALSTDQTMGFFLKQIIFFAIALVAYFVVSSIDYRFFRQWTRLLYIIGIVLLIAVLIFGTTVRGTTGWFSLFGISFQPVEFMKLIMVLVLAKYFSERARRQFDWKEILSSGLLTLVPAILVMLQPDFGSAAVLIGTWMILMFFAGIKLKHVAALLGVVVVVGAIFWGVVFADYQKDRIMTFIDPSRDPLGRGYNVNQAMIAIGSGQLFGKGLGFGSQSQLKFLPESQTDFVFAVIAEELGFFGVLFLLVAFFLIFYRGFRAAEHMSDDYASFLLMGFLAILFIHVCVNVGMNLGLTPVTGISLPFVSYGGSALLMAFILLGMMQNVAIRTRRKVK